LLWEQDVVGSNPACPILIMDLDFLNNYWMQDRVSRNKHFIPLNSVLCKKINCRGIIDDKIPTRYKGFKTWDIHFPNKKIAIEYKTIATEQQEQFVLKNHKRNTPYKNLTRNIGNRIEEAIGCATDIKRYDNQYKLGYVMVFTLRREKNLLMPKEILDKIIDTFDTMVEDGLYDFFCPLITFGMDDHAELSETYSFNNFIEQIKNTPSNNKYGLEHFFIE
jgi:hypothetical protein